MYKVCFLVKKTCPLGSWLHGVIRLWVTELDEADQKVTGGGVEDLHKYGMHGHIVHGSDFFILHTSLDNTFRSLSKSVPRLNINIAF